MKRISLCSLQGGAGATSLAAMLGDTLSRLGETVVVVDLNESDLLRLHFGVGYDDPHGWAAALAQGRDWHEHAFQVREGLMLLPYGRQGLAPEAPPPSGVDDRFWIEAGEQLAAAYSWLIFDLPSGLRRHAALRASCDVDLVVAQPDMASHVLLMQAQLPAHSSIVVNRLDPQRRLATDIVLDWRQRFGAQLVPLQLDHDENVHEALARRQPVTSLSPEALGSRDALSLATWCLARTG